MNRLVQFLVLAFVVMATAATSWSAPSASETQRDDSASQIAKAWFVSLMQGETAVTNSLSAVPFLFDGKHQVQTHAELKKIYDSVVEKKGKRDVKPASVKIMESKPKSVVVQIMIEGDDEAITVTVKPGETFHVVGFRD